MRFADAVSTDMSAVDMIAHNIPTRISPFSPCGRTFTISIARTLFEDSSSGRSSLPAIPRYVLAPAMTRTAIAAYIVPRRALFISFAAMQRV